MSVCRELGTFVKRNKNHLRDYMTTGPGACFSKDPVTTGPDNLPGRLTGNFTGTGIAFLEAPVNFPDTYRVQ